ncbi:hypothetical protein K501DRAFT_182665 [Backusella circina FSU 941]|nr:hypothetical protein K501DRAFT_182665 [Backusella circina FSU 941]
MSPILKSYNLFILEKLRAPTDRDLYLRCCRHTNAVDPIIYLPMVNTDRSRIIRWKRGWLPGKTILCTNCSSQAFATRPHLISCLGLLPKINHHTANNSHHPLDTILNYLPLKPAKTKPLQIQEYLFWKDRWPAILFFLLKVDEICHPTSVFSDKARNIDPSPLYQYLHPEFSLV